MRRHLEDALRECYFALNGRHEMTPADDRYVDEHFVAPEALGDAEGGPDADELGRLMLAGALPLPTYVRSDGRLMVSRDLLALADRAGGVDALAEWFGGHFADGATGAAEWGSYLRGLYFACLRQVTPATIRCKDELMDTIDGMVAAPRPTDAEWLVALHGHVDELDALELPFTPYDRLRFGRPTSRDRCITEIRRAFPCPVALRAGAA